ncbi:MAG: carboxypeptidase regulatory-like domain-containing protein [Planctomycetota bacterium]|jgi:outer membrane lipoprotein-sorting protein
MRPADNIRKSFKELHIPTSAELDEQINAEISMALVKAKNNKSADPLPNIWRIIMKSKMTKFAAAAVIIVAVVLVLDIVYEPELVSGAFADVVQPLLAVEAGSFKMTIDVTGADLDWINYGDDPVQTIDVVFAEPGRTRWDTPTGETLIVNMQEGKLMILMHAEKQAAVMQLGPAGMIPVHNRFNKLLELKPFIRYALEVENDSVEFLGEREIEDVTAIGYSMTNPQHHGDITVWADAETKQPVLIEQSMGTQTAIISGIAYDLDMTAESLFSVEPPEGYLASTSEGDEEPKFVVTGTVIDAATGQPIAGAKVTDDGYGPEPYKGAITDSEGEYSYLTWPEEHRIKAEAPGYKPQHKGLTGLFHVENENEKVIDFALEPE